MIEAKPCVFEWVFQDCFLAPFCFHFYLQDLLCFVSSICTSDPPLAKLTTSGYFWLLTTDISSRINAQLVKVDYNSFQFIEIKKKKVVDFLIVLMIISIFQIGSKEKYGKWILNLDICWIFYFDHSTANIAMYISSWFEYQCNLSILLMWSLNQISEIETSHEVSK